MHSPLRTHSQHCLTIQLHKAAVDVKSSKPANRNDVLCVAAGFGNEKLPPAPWYLRSVSSVKKQASQVRRFSAHTQLNCRLQ